MRQIVILFVMLFCMIAHAQNLPRIAVYATGGKTADENSMFADQITHALVSSRRFMMIERAEAFIDQVEREHVTQRSGAIDTSQIARLGRQAGAQFVCIAQIVDAYGGHQVSARIVNAETVIITHSGIALGELKNISDFRKLSQELVKSLLETNQQAPPPPLPSHLNPNTTYGLFTDSRDNQTYRTVLMPDGKTWMAENLNFATSSGSWCYDNNAANCNTYGRLYNWATARNVCPAGWHLPSNAEWDVLVNAVGNWREVDTKLRASSGWQSHSGTPRGTDDFGFSALPGGRRDDGKFEDIGLKGGWWTATELDARRVWNREMEYDHYEGGFSESWYYKSTGLGLSVRCVRN